MKRDWDVIRDVLIEVEAIGPDELNSVGYGVGPEHAEQDQIKSGHAILLWKTGFIEAADASSMAGPAIVAPELTWQGHELLATLRSKPVWEKIKSTAQDKGIDLTFDSVIALGKVALAWVIAQGS